MTKIAVELHRAAVVQDAVHDLDQELVLGAGEDLPVQSVNALLELLPHRRFQYVDEDAAHLGDLVVFDAAHHQMHHRRLEQQATLGDFGERGNAVMLIRRRLVHALEYVIGIIGQIGAAADLAAHQALALHHGERTPHRAAAGVEPLGQLILVGKLGARHHVPVLEAAQQRPIDERGCGALMRRDGRELGRRGGH